MENMTLKMARKYLNNFGWSLIPIRADGSKAPSLESWKEFQTRHPTDMELVKWFSDTKALVGVVTGSISNLSVVDVDTKDKSVLVTLTSPISVTTPKGRHLYFKYKEGLGNAVRFIEHCDIRSEGGYCLLPPSTGYRWVNPYFKPSSLCEFPTGLIPAQTTSTKPRLKGRIGELLSGLKEGNRDQTFTSVIGLMHRDSYPASDILALLSPYAESSGFGIVELERKIDYLTSRYSNKNIIPQEEEADLKSFLMDIQPVEWLCKPILAKGTLGFIAGLPETQKTWIMMDLAIEMSRTDKGGVWLNKFPVEHGRVLFIDQERFKGETQRRLKALLAEKELDSSKLELYVQSGTTTRINLDESFQAFKRKLEEIRPDLIIIDSFATFHTTEENNRKEVQTVLERVKEIRTHFGCAVLFIDHENKSVFDPNDSSLPNAFKMVGSVGKPAAAEMVLTVRKNKENQATVYHTKSTLASTVEPFHVSVSDTDRGINVKAV